MRKLLPILIVFSACKKSGDSNSTSTVSITVTETVSGQPVTGASVSLHRCANLGCAFGTVTEFQGTTNNSGTCNVPVANYNNVPVWNDAIFVTKVNYWPQTFSKSTSLSITPKGWMQIRIVKGANYPQGSKLKLNVWNQGQPSNVNLEEFNIASDSLIVVSGFGNQLNKIDWQVSDNLNLFKSGTWNQQVPRLDTVRNITLNY